MTPEQLLRGLGKQRLEGVYLFIGPETYRRGPCRRALIENTLAADDREDGYVRHDLDSLSLNDVIDDAEGVSLVRLPRIAAEQAEQHPRADQAVEPESRGCGRGNGKVAQKRAAPKGTAGHCDIHTGHLHAI